MVREAVKLIEDTFERPFDKAKFTLFVKDIFKHIDTSDPFVYRGNPIRHSFEPYISSLERIGQHVDPEGKEIDILIAQLRKDNSLERARTMQRNFISWYLNGSRGGKLKDAALVAFVSPDEADWRFSLVKMEYVLESTPAGKVKVRQELTPARRWSFLVGASERSHTAKRQLVPLLEDDAPELTLALLEEAFNIETVTREFYEKYRGLFIEVKQALDRVEDDDPRLRTEFSGKGVDTVNFAKKMLGQIVFLYFLQKKGWFGVPRHGKWGEGSRHFLRELFEGKHGPYQNFFNDILEHLFYVALRHDRSNIDQYYPQFNCRVPFLNGGLFDPMNNYSWDQVHILLPNSLFSNQEKTREGDEGTGILDVFDRYNFTVQEDEPFEKEVALDPELLGKAYEKFNAIRPDNFNDYLNVMGKKGEESRFNKEYGVYYTPREVVQYMCQESLISYLDTALNTGDVPLVREKPTNLRLMGAPATHQWALAAPGNTNRVPRRDIEEFVRSGERAIEHDARVESKGKETRDYSYMLPESIRWNSALIDGKLADVRVCDPAIGSGAFPVGLMTEIVRARETLSTYLPDKTGRNRYAFKRNAIENSLYGVDIDPGAVEIAKLRLWLSLVVDEEDIQQIKPLPNLDYKIVRGDSLLGVERNMFNNELFQELERLKPKYFNETNAVEKSTLRNQIDELIKSVTNNGELFDFEVYFSEVFHEKGGFDVIIANPPYISHDKLGSKDHLRKHFVCFEPFADLYCYFVELGVNLQNPSGIICYITSNSYIKAKYGAPLRDILRKRTTLLELIDIEDYQVFDTAIVNTAVILARRKGGYPNAECTVVSARHDGTDFRRFVEHNVQRYAQGDFLSEPWSLTSRAKLDIARKIERAGRTLEGYHAKIRLGIATGANKAFLLDEVDRLRLIQRDPKNDLVIRPVLRGRDISRYGYRLAKQYILLTKNGINVRREYPTVYEYLESFGNEFKNRGAQGNHWTNLRNCSFYDDFKREKIVWIELTNEGRFALCTEEVYLLNSAYFLLPPPEIPARYLLGILNSRLMQFYLGMIAQTSGMGVTRWINEYVRKFPVPEARMDAQGTVANIVGKVLSAKHANPGADVSALERQIDEMVYRLYGLTAEEIAVVEGSVKRPKPATDPEQGDSEEESDGE